MNCNACNNNLFIQCHSCKGFGQLKYLKYKATVKKCIDDVIINCKDDSIPLKVILKSKGTIIVNETKSKLNAISSYPDDVVYQSCKDLLRKHDDKVEKSTDWQLVNQVNNTFRNTKK